MKNIKNELLNEVEVKEMSERLNNYKKQQANNYQKNTKFKSEFKIFRIFSISFSFVVLFFIVLFSVDSLIVHAYNSNIDKKIRNSIKEELVYVSYNNMPNYSHKTLKKKTPLINNVFEIVEFISSPKNATHEDTLPAEIDENETNNQVAGIDEAEIIKVDNNTVYYLSNFIIYIYEKKPLTKELELVNTINLVENNTFLRPHSYANLYLSKDYLIVNLSTYNNYTLLIFTKSGEFKKSLSFDGTLVDNRLKDNSIYFVVNVYEKNYYVNDNLLTVDYNDINCIPIFQQFRYLQIGVINLDTLSHSIKTEYINQTHLIYMSENSLYLVLLSYKYDRILSVIIKYNYTSNDVIFDKLMHVFGYLKDQYSLDEYNGYLRVAATDSYKESKLNSVYVFNLNDEEESLLPKGEIHDIGLGKQTIKSVRFSPYKVELVTYETRDPLYLITITDNTILEITSVLEAPGYSDYLHTFIINEQEYLIGLGYSDSFNIKISYYLVTNNEHNEIFTNQFYDTYNSSFIPKKLFLRSINEVIYVGFGVYDSYILTSFNTTYNRFETITLNDSYNTRCVTFDNYIYALEDNVVTLYDLNLNFEASFIYEVDNS